ncbi:MAG: LamB/YcsF family protein [Armatimonadetes bacterium]|nr:LamB/YcsF family protein [Armatimonadota bacterium]
MRGIDLNVDLGEGFEHDEALLKYATSANVCLGAHAGSKELTLETVKLCQSLGVRVGAHPGYPDRDHMGRRSVTTDVTREWFDSLVEQVNWIRGQVEIGYLKPHGGFYNDTAIPLPHDYDVAIELVPEVDRYRAAGRYVSEFPGVHLLSMLLRISNVPLMGLPKTLHRIAAEKGKVGLIHEGFADRRMNPDGTLVPRGQPGAMITSGIELESQVRRLGHRVESICVHGDGPNAVEFIERAHHTLRAMGLEVRAWK